MSAQYNITVNKNASFKRTFEVRLDNTVVDITGYDFEASLKENYHSETTVEFSVAITDAVSGLFTINLPYAITATMDPGTWVYDVVMTDTSGLKTRLMEGKAFVKQGVTV